MITCVEPIVSVIVGVPTTLTMSLNVTVIGMRWPRVYVPLGITTFRIVFGSTYCHDVEYEVIICVRASVWISGSLFSVS